MITLALLTHLTVATFKQVPVIRTKTEQVVAVKPTKTEITEAFRRSA